MMSDTDGRLERVADWLAMEYGPDLPMMTKREHWRIDARELLAALDAEPGATLEGVTPAVAWATIRPIYYNPKQPEHIATYVVGLHKPGMIFDDPFATGSGSTIAKAIHAAVDAAAKEAT